MTGSLLAIWLKATLTLIITGMFDLLVV